jgi:hypothetical protein
MSQLSTKICVTSAKDFVRLLTAQREAKRPSIKQALQHKWLDRSRSMHRLQDSAHPSDVTLHEDIDAAESLHAPSLIYGTDGDSGSSRDSSRRQSLTGDLSHSALESSILSTVQSTRIGSSCIDSLDALHTDLTQ